MMSEPTVEVHTRIVRAAFEAFHAKWQVQIAPRMPHPAALGPHTRARIYFGGCATWWLYRPPSDGMYVASCSLPAHHAAPHVDLSCGEVALGHETDLAHASPLDDLDAVWALQRSDDWEQLALPHGVVKEVALRWWQARPPVVTHDSATCGRCPAEVW